MDINAAPKGSTVTTVTTSTNEHGERVEVRDTFRKLARGWRSTSGDIFAEPYGEIVATGEPFVLVNPPQEAFGSDGYATLSGRKIIAAFYRDKH